MDNTVWVLLTAAKGENPDFAKYKAPTYIPQWKNLNESEKHVLLHIPDMRIPAPPTWPFD